MEEQTPTLNAEQTVDAEVVAEENMTSEGAPAPVEPHQGSATKDDTRPRGDNDGTAPIVKIHFRLGKKKLAEMKITVENEKAAEALTNDLCGKISNYIQQLVQMAQMARSNIVIPVAGMTPAQIEELKARAEAMMPKAKEETRAGGLITATK